MTRPFWCPPGALLLGAIVAASCAPPPDEQVGTLRFGIVQDSAIFKIIEAFQIHVVKATTTAGASVTCSDIPSNFRPGDTQLQTLIDPVGIPWKGSTDEVRSSTFKVPGGEKAVVIVTGLTRYEKGVHTVARGCLDNLIFKAGSTESLSVDVKATTGMACTTTPECEVNLVCNTGTTFPGGYCAKVSCMGDVQCPPGTHCVTDSSLGGICLGICDAAKDCATSPPQTQDCDGRVGYTTSGCPAVCVYPLWNKANKCTPE
jgi:hypothetical protein